VSVQPLLAPPSPDGDRALVLEGALSQLLARAGELDANPRFPRANFESLKRAGVPQLAGERSWSTFAAEIELVRAVASADASTARILDGHFNGAERIALLAPEGLRERELDGVRRGDLLLGVWGADPGGGEGPPAALVQRGGGRELVLDGVKTFCSGAGGVQRALVVARDETEARRLVYVDVTQKISIDRDWYRASGLRASESHRVEFHETPVLAVLGEPDETVREPWFARDAVRTAATWAGIADRIVAATVQALGARPADDLRLHALGRMRVAQGSIDRWLEHAVSVLVLAGDAAREGANAIERAVTPVDPRAVSAETRIALADAGRLIAAEAVRVCGSRALIDGGALDRARRDLDLFLLQHRLDPKLIELGAQTLIESGAQTLAESAE
jgi:alkylation response protein AidB-like acyl-CoA dehydrogenase